MAKKKPTPTQKLNAIREYLKDWRQNLDERKQYLADDMYDDSIDKEKFDELMGQIENEMDDIRAIYRILNGDL